MKNIHFKKQTPEPVVIGIPRAMLYFRYEMLWKNFFSELGVKYIVSEPTNKEILRVGASLAIDEACLSTKIFLGHVQSLIGKCDYIFVPRISNFGLRRNMCTKFEALHDICCNVFRNTGQQFISYNIDELNGLTEEKAFIELGEELGYSKKTVLAAYRHAKKTEYEFLKNQLRAQNHLFKKDGLKILIASHSYVEMDEYIGKPVLNYLKKMDVIPIFADIVDRRDAARHAIKLSSTLKWEYSKEIMGGIDIYRDKIDGVILMSAFPCGPDSMVNEMIIRRFRGTPILNIVLDEQDGTAGLETRLESFIDILKFKGGTL